MKKLAIWSTLLLLLLCIPSCHPRQQPQSEPEGDTTPIYNLPIVDYDFAGSPWGTLLISRSPMRRLSPLVPVKKIFLRLFTI